MFATMSRFTQSVARDSEGSLRGSVENLSTSTPSDLSLQEEIKLMDLSSGVQKLLLIF